MSAREIFIGRKGSFVSKRHKKIRWAVPICPCWTIFNAAVFEKVVVTDLGLNHSFAYTLWSWANIFPDLESRSVNDFFIGLWGLYRVVYGLVSCCFLSPVLFCFLFVCLLKPAVYFLYTLGTPPFFNTF